MTTIEVDFNSRDEAGMVPALVEEAHGTLRVGDSVEAFDDEGYRCPAIVAATDPDVVTLDPLWRAFASPGQARITVMKSPPAMWVDLRNRLTVTFAPSTVVDGAPSTTATRELAVA